MNIKPSAPNKITIIETHPIAHIIDGEPSDISERCYVPDGSVGFEARIGLKGLKYTKSYW